MKRFHHLTEAEKNHAIQKALQILVHELLIRSRKLADPDLQRLVDDALTKTDGMRAEWRGSAWLIEIHGEKFRPLAQSDALNAFYPESHERVIPGVA